MSKIADDKIDLLALRLVGGRMNPVPSNAHPAEFYDDPLKSAKLAFDRCGGCKYERQIMAGPAVGEWLCQRKDQDGEERKHGARCGDFRQKGTKCQK